ncbi:TPA: hypothetical protein ACIHDA_002300, partial [Salmonella enterica subsp. enterica serovar Typhimurium]
CPAVSVRCPHRIAGMTKKGKKGANLAQSGDSEDNIKALCSSRRAPCWQEKFRAIMAPFTRRRKVKSALYTSQIIKLLTA